MTSENKKPGKANRSSEQSERVGVRELRQNLSVYLRRVKDGEALQVTDRGEPVALLIPLPALATPLETLVASGRAVPAENDLAQLGRPTESVSPSLSEALLESRQERL